MSRPKLIGFRWNQNRFEVNFFGLAPFSQKTKPSIPGILFDNFLHYEPSANIAEYTYQGVGHKMTPEQISACEEYAAHTEFLGFTYDPLRYNIFMGIRTVSEAKAKGLKLTYTPITTDLCKFNEDTNTWDTVHAIICKDGLPFLNFLNSYNIKDDDRGSDCSAEMQDAVLMLTKEEWDIISKTRLHDFDVYNFKTHTWEDKRDFKEEQQSLIAEVSSRFESWQHGYKYLFLGGFGVSDLEWMLDNPDNIDEQVASIVEYSKQIGYPLEEDIVKNSILQAVKDLKAFEILRKKYLLEVWTFQFSINQCTELKELDAIKESIADILVPKLDIYGHNAEKATLDE